MKTSASSKIATKCSSVMICDYIYKIDDYFTFICYLADFLGDQ